MHSVKKNVLLQEFRVQKGIRHHVVAFDSKDVPASNRFVFEEQGPSKDYVRLNIDLDLGSSFLLTHVNFITKETEKAKKLFKFLLAEYNAAGLERTFIPSLQAQDFASKEKYTPQMITRAPEETLVSTIAIGSVARLSFVLNQKEVQAKYEEVDDFDEGEGDKFENVPSLDGLDKGAADSLKNKVFSTFARFFLAIQFQGYSLQQSPSASQVVQLLNISNLFKKNGRLEEAIETDILLGLSLTGARRFLQAAEILKKASQYFLQRHIENKPTMEATNIFQGKLIDFPEQSTYSPRGASRGNMSLNSSSVQLNNNNFSDIMTSSKPLLRAAKIELLVAEAINQPSMMKEKIQAYLRATEYFSGQKINFQPNFINKYDIYSILLKMSPYLSKFLIKTLYDPLDPLRIAAMKGLEFLIEHMGCTIGAQLPILFKTILQTYPTLDKGFDDFGSSTDRFGAQSKASLSGKKQELEIGDLQREFRRGNSLDPKQDLLQYSQNGSKGLYDSYHHLLETFLNVLASASSSILRQIFYDVIAGHLFQEGINDSLRNYIMIISEKIISICQGDIEIQVGFISNMISLLIASRGFLRSSAQKLWETVKIRSIINLNKNESNKLVDWVGENLMNLSESEQLSPQELLRFQYLLDIISLLCLREKKIGQNLPVNLVKFTKKIGLNNNMDSLVNLLKPLLVWLEATLYNQSRFEIFKSVWRSLVEVSNTLSASTDFQLTDIALPILYKIHDFCICSSPSIHMLNFLIIVLSVFEQCNISLQRFVKEFILVFSDCIPHSIHDESFTVFDILIKLSSQYLTEEIIRKCTLSLIDQYTVKGKAQKQSLKNFIFIIMNQNIDMKEKERSYLQVTLKISLLENLEPQPRDFSAESSKIKGSKTDKKQYDRLFQMFTEKLDFCQEILTQLNEKHLDLISDLLANGSLQDVLGKLVASGFSHIRLKGLSICNSIFKAFVCAIPGEEEEFFTNKKLLISRLLISILKLSLESFNDPKLQFNALLILDQFFQKILLSSSLATEIGRFKAKASKGSPANVHIIDILTQSLGEDEKISHADDRYLHLRMHQIINLLPAVRSLMGSQWSNIKSLAYGLFCHWVKADLMLYKQSMQKKFTKELFAVLMSLVSSKESECRTGGLNILGSLCGLGFNFDDMVQEVKNNIGFFRRHEKFVPLAIWETVYELQSDWDPTNQAAAITLIQLCSPRDSVKQLYRLKREAMYLRMNRVKAVAGRVSGQSLSNCKEFLKIFQNMSGGQQTFFEDSGLNSLNKNKYQQDSDGKTTEILNQELNFINHESSQSSMKSVDSADNFDDIEFFWMELCTNEEIRDTICMFRNEFQPPHNLWIERVDYNLEGRLPDNMDRVTIENDEEGSVFRDTFAEMNSKKQEAPHDNLGDKDKIHEEELDFDDLGIIEVEDEEWNEFYDHEQKILKKNKSGKYINDHRGASGSAGESRSSKDIESAPWAAGKQKIEYNNFVSKPPEDEMEFKNMDRDGFKKKPFKLDEKSALRPHNPLFRPLTPPIKKENNASSFPLQGSSLYQSQIKRDKGLEEYPEGNINIIDLENPNENEFGFHGDEEANFGPGGVYSHGMLARAGNEEFVPRGYDMFSGGKPLNRQFHEDFFYNQRNVRNKYSPNIRREHSPHALNLQDLQYKTHIRRDSSEFYELMSKTGGKMAERESNSDNNSSGVENTTSSNEAKSFGELEVPTYGQSYAHPQSQFIQDAGPQASYNPNLFAASNTKQSASHNKAKMDMNRNKTAFSSMSNKVEDSTPIRPKDNNRYNNDSAARESPTEFQSDFNDAPSSEPLREQTLSPVMANEEDEDDVCVEKANGAESAERVERNKRGGNKAGTPGGEEGKVNEAEPKAKPLDVEIKKLKEELSSGKKGATADNTQEEYHGEAKEPRARGNVEERKIDKELESLGASSKLISKLINSFGNPVGNSKFNSAAGRGLKGSNLNKQEVKKREEFLKKLIGRAKKLIDTNEVNWTSPMKGEENKRIPVDLLLDSLKIETPKKSQVNHALDSKRSKSLNKPRYNLTNHSAYLPNSEKSSAEGRNMRSSGINTKKFGFNLSTSLVNNNNSSQGEAGANAGVAFNLNKMESFQRMVLNTKKFLKKKKKLAAKEKNIKGTKNINNSNISKKTESKPKPAGAVPDGSNDQMV